jgi:hypothetical protein
MKTWREWLRQIGAEDRKVPLTQDRKQAVSKWIEAHKKELNDAYQSATAKSADEARAKEQLQEFFLAEGFYDQLVAAGLRVPKPMHPKYTGQLIILLDEDLAEVAMELQRKREIAGDGARSQIWNWAKKKFDPPLEGGATPLSFTADTRVYVLAHGAPDSESLVRKEGKEWVPWHGPDEIVAALRDCFGLLGVTGVKRLTLVTCFAAGNSTGRDNNGERVQSTASLAQKVFNALHPLVTEVSGYSEGVTTKSMGRKIDDKAVYASVRKVTGGGQNEHKQPNRKVTFYKDKANITQSRGEYLTPPAAAAAGPKH